MTWQRLLCLGVISVFFLPIAGFFALLELSTVDRAECDWENFDRICSDYEGTYGIVCGLLLIVWALSLWALIRKTSGRD